MTKLLFILAVLNPFALEWNSNWRTDVPYEIAIDLDRIGQSGQGMMAFADGRPVNTVRLVDTVSRRTRFRFNVPSGTRSLAMRPGRCFAMESSAVDNIFSQQEWKADSNIKMTKTQDGILLESFKWAPGKAVCRVPVPENAAGKPVVFEMDSRSLAGMVWCSVVYMNQYDKDGKLLPDYVYDSRWTTLARPSGVFVPSRERGYIHPRAAFLEMTVEMRPNRPAYDVNGLKISNPEAAKPRLLISRLSLRCAAEIPFPSLRNSFWAGGVSGREDDLALSLDDNRCFWFTSRSMACWAKGEQVRDEDEIFFPSGAGTVEMWVKPQWKQGSKSRFYFFDAANSNSIAGQPEKARISKGSMVAVSYVPSDGTLRMEFRDVTRKAFTAECKNPIPSGEWTHVALSWNPSDRARLFINGKVVLEKSLAGYEAFNLAEDPCPNDSYVMAVYVGADHRSARSITEKARKIEGTVFLTGSFDRLRISSGERYVSDFEPEKQFGSDTATKAFFDFNKSIDGVSATGLGWISGSLRAQTDILNHDFNGIQYFPASLTDENNPDKVLHPRTKYVPTEKDCNTAYKTVRTSFDAKPGESRSIEVPSGTITDYVEIANTGSSPLVYPIVIKKGEIDGRSYGDIAESLNEGNLNDRQRVNRIFDFLLEKSDYFMNHTIAFDYGTDKASSVEYSALKMLNSYCGFECGPLNNLCMSLFTTAGNCAANMIYGNGHSFEQVFYDGCNHVYDLSPQTFFPAMDNETAAGLRESEVEPGVHYRIGASCDHFTRYGTRKINPTTVRYVEKFAMSLNPGEAIRFWTANDWTMNDLQVKTWAHHGIGGTDYTKTTCADPSNGGVWKIDRFFPEFSNAFLLFDGAPSQSNPAFTNIESDSFCYSVRTCYPIVAAEYKAELSGGKTAELEISTDLGKTFRPFSSPADYTVRARHGYLIRVKAPISKVKRFKASTELQVNRRMITGLLEGGTNEIRLKAQGDGNAKISYMYRVPDKEIRFNGAICWGAIRGFEQSLVLLDPAAGKLDIRVSGTTPATKLDVCGDVDARLAGNILTLKTKNRKQRFAWVTLRDGEIRRTLTVLVSPDSRLEKVEGVLESKRDNVEVEFEPITGEYMLLTLMRGPVELDMPTTTNLFVRMGNSGRVSAGHPINQRFDYLKDVIGPDGGRGIWRWDAAMAEGKYPLFPVRKFQTSRTGSLTYSFNGVDGPIEIAYTLLIPSPDKAFTAEIAKALFGRNGRPWAIKND